MPIPVFIEAPVPRRDQAGNIVLSADGRPLAQIGPDGRPVVGIKINQSKLHIRGYWLTASDQTTVLAAAGAAGDEATVRFEVDPQGHFDWAYIMGTSTGPYTLEWFDGGRQQRLQNKPVHNVTIVGSAVRAFRLPQPYFISVGKSRREISCIVRNLHTQQNTVELVLYGRRFYHNDLPAEVAADILKKHDSGLKTYSFFLVPRETKDDGDVDAIAAGESSTLDFQADDDADFEMHKLTFSANGSFNFLLRERDKQDALMGAAVESVSGWGNAEFPDYFDPPLLLQRRKDLLFDIINTSGQSLKVFSTISGKRVQLR